MALDGVTISNIVYELNEKIKGGRVDKIYQPEKDEVILNLRSLGQNLKLLLTASASHPRLHLTEEAKENPMQAPLFCMVLRKHLTGGKILSISQPGFERIVEIVVESMSEMGDMSPKTLIIEVMGKHSNIILTDERGVILDAVKHVSFETSAVREVLPGKAYTRPPNQDKRSPLDFSPEDFKSVLMSNSYRAQEVFFKIYSGLSPFVAGELCHRAAVDPDKDTKTLSAAEITALTGVMAGFVNGIQNRAYTPFVLFANGKPLEFSCVPMTQYDGFERKDFESVSKMLAFYYGEKDKIVRKNQKTTDLRKLIGQNLERCAKKKAMYEKTLKDIEGREAHKIRGELLTANLHTLEKGMTSVTVANYYDPSMAELTIALDPNLTPSENAQRHYRKYNKEKRTFAALQAQITQNEAETAYLESLQVSLSNCETEADAEELRDEMAQQGFAKRRGKHKKGVKPKKSKPLHFVSGDGFHMYVGKNNRQNDDLTLRFAENGDLWFHTKEIPGSHVIVRTDGQPVPDQTLNEAAHLAAFYSKASGGSHVPVDYTAKKNVKKPNGAKPGMVIYERYQTAVVTPNEALVNSLRQTD